MRFHFSRAGFFDSFRLSKDAIRVLPNACWIAGEKALRLVIGVAITAIVARYLGISQFGLLNLAIALVSIWSVFGLFGMQEIAVRELVRSETPVGQTVGSAFCLQFIGGVFVFVLAGFSSILVRPGDHLFVGVVFLIASAGLFRASSAIRYWFDSRLISRYAVWAESIAFAVSTSLKLYFVYIGADLLPFALTNLVEAAVVAVLLFLFYRRHPESPEKVRATVSTVLFLAREGWPVAMASLAVMVYMRIDQVMLGMLSSPTSVGAYAAAIRLSEAWHFLPVAIVASAFPVLVQTRENNRILYARKLQRLYSSMVLLSVCVALPLSLASPILVSLVFGQDYTAAIPVLAIHVWTSVFVVLGLVGVKWLIAENLSHMVLYQTVFGAVLNIILNILFIPRYGVAGAAAATLSSYAAMVFLPDLILPKLRVNFRRKLNALLLRDLL